MKKLFALLLTLVLFVVFTLPAFALETWESLGYKNDDLGSRWSVSYGSRAWGNFGYDIGAAFYAQYDGLVSGPCNNFVTINSESKNYSIGFDLLYFQDVSDSVTLYGGPGVYFISCRDIARSTDNGLLYDQDHNTTKTWITGTAGVQIKLKDNFKLGLGYHLVRGYTFQFVFNR